MIRDAAAGKPNPISPSFVFHPRTPDRTDAFLRGARHVPPPIYDRHTLERAARSAPNGASARGISNLGMVAPGIFRGAQPDAVGSAELKAAGIRNMVDLRELPHTSDLQGLDMGYLHIAASSWPPKDSQVLDFLKFATNPANQPLMVHCDVGKDRTGLMVAAYRIVVQHWSKDRAIAEMKDYGYHGIAVEINSYLEHMNPAAMRASLRHWPEPKATIIR